MVHSNFTDEVKGLDAFPEDTNFSFLFLKLSLFWYCSKSSHVGCQKCLSRSHKTIDTIFGILRFLEIEYLFVFVVSSLGAIWECLYSQG